tara:strand:+ start:4694 stop:4888 length:195 start_codon:yes stop_codon:yes gene_type:complete
MSTYDLPNSILEIYEKNKEVTMKEQIKKLLKEYGENQANLASKRLREVLTDEIIKIIETKNATR